MSFYTAGLGTIKFGCVLTLDIFGISFREGSLQLVADGNCNPMTLPTGFVPMSIYGEDGALVATGKVDTTESFREARNNKVNHIMLTQKLNIDYLTFKD